MMEDAQPRAALRRHEALAYIVDRIVRTGTCPSAGEIGRALKVSRTRAQQLTEELIVEQVLEKTPGSPRSLRIRDLAQCRHIIIETLRRLGLTVADPLGKLMGPLSSCQLPVLAPFEYLPDPD